MLLPLALALITTWAVQYFIINRYFGTESSGTKSGQTFTAPANAIQAKPLRKEVDFIDKDISVKPEITRIETDNAIYQFSNEGASLQQLIFKRKTNGQQILMTTLEHSSQYDREKRCFLIALDEKTPYAYKLVDRKDEQKKTVLTYKAETDQALIEKTFEVKHDTFQIDLHLSITPKNQLITPRILFSAPYMASVKDDTISGVYNDEKGSIQKEARSKIDMNKGWFAPTFFGSDDRYFVHAMIAHENSFAQRAYYNLEGQSGLISILEGPEIKEKTDWVISFYCGPKEEEIMNLVDPRLQQTLDYSGLLAPISRFLLEVLKFLYKYLYNYGWAIVLLTLAINLILLPFNIRSNKSMKQYGEFQKKLAYIQHKYKDDPDTLARERAELLSKNGMPGLGGCLPKLLQLPIFFALSRVLSSSIELYKAPWILWIKDLSAKDPYYILPLCITLLMLFQAPASEPKQRFTMIAVAIIFGAVSTNFSAGLCLYIFVGVLLNGMQQTVQKRFGWA